MVSILTEYIQEIPIELVTPASSGVPLPFWFILKCICGCDMQAF